MNKRTIIFYAPVGTGLPQYLLGGGEVGCRRTREILTSGDYNVITIDKPTMGNGARNYIKSAIESYYKVCKHLFLDKRSILYVVGFYEKNIYLEWLLINTGRILQHKTIYEARNGRLVIAYYEYGKLYKLMMDNILRKADKIFCQGLEFVKFIEQEYQRAAVYTPNYVLNKNIQRYNENRPMDIIKLIYFGRVTVSKNINVLIETCGELIRRGYKVEAMIIGAYTEEYKKDLDQKILSLNMAEETIIFLGQQPFEFISSKLQEAHFFLFPSQEKKEGHSNSLTEAMTFGVVPIASTAGFNSSIVAKSELIIDKIDAIHFADVIEKIVRNGLWDQYSKFVYKRVKENYTEDKVKSVILDAMNKI